MLTSKVINFSLKIADLAMITVMCFVVKIGSLTKAIKL